MQRFCDESHCPTIHDIPDFLFLLEKKNLTDLSHITVNRYRIKYMRINPAGSSLVMLEAVRPFIESRIASAAAVAVAACIGGGSNGIELTGDV